MEIKKIAVIGSNSFTGSHFVDYVLSNTDAEVIGISRSPEYDTLFLPYAYKKSRPERFTFFQMDMNKDTDKVIALLDKEKPDIVVNYSAQAEVRNSWKWPEQWFQTNCMAIVRFTNALKDRKYLKRYVSVSTPEVYGSTKMNVPESFNFYPSTPYAASKLAGDLFLLTLFKKYNFPVVFTRSANVYGVHQQLYRIIPRTIIYLKMGRKIQLHGGGKTIRSFIHVKDVADGTWRAITLGNNGEVYHLSEEGKTISISELVKVICEMMGFDFESSVEVVDENFGQDGIYSLSPAKARKELGWEASIPFREGILEMIRWIEEDWEKIKIKPLDYVHQA